MMFNFAQSVANERDGETRLHFLVDPRYVPNWQEMAAFYSDQGLAGVWPVPERITQLPSDQCEVMNAVPRTEYSAERFLADSVRCLEGIRALEDRLKSHLDIVEFPDFGALGYAAVSAKLAGTALTDTLVSVRLHSSSSVIKANEPGYHKKGPGELALESMERACLLHADLVVGHLDSTIRANQDFYCFPDSWRQKVALEFPPTALTEEERNARSAFPGREHFVFSSRLQPFKRPDLFLSAATMHLLKNPESNARFTVASYGWDGNYIHSLTRLVPPHLRDRISFVTDPHPDVRDTLLSDSTVVIPSEYESLCLLAYESHLRGCHVILNQRCSAFGDEAFWHQASGVDFFDGTANDLARTFEEVAAKRANSDILHIGVQGGPPRPALPPSGLYSSTATAQEESEGAELKVAVVAWVDPGKITTNRVVAPWIGLTRASSHVRLWLLGTVREHLGASGEGTPAVAHFSVSDLAAGALRNANQEWQPDALLLLPPDVLVHPSFLTEAVNTLRSDPALDIITCQTARASVEGSSSGWQSGDRDGPWMRHEFRAVLPGTTFREGIDLGTTKAPLLVRSESLVGGVDELASWATALDVVTRGSLSGNNLFSLASIGAWDWPDWSLTL